MTCPKQGCDMEAVVLHWVRFLAYSCPKQGQNFKPSAEPLHPNMGQVPPIGGEKSRKYELSKDVRVKLRQCNIAKIYNRNGSQIYIRDSNSKDFYGEENLTRK